MTKAIIPLALYIHIPFCIRKCPYCDFYSHAAGETCLERAQHAAPLRNYGKQTVADLGQDISYVQNRELQSIYFGGGTPSLLEPELINNLLENINTYISFADDIEITLEANPGTVNAAKLKKLLTAGINRLSIGVQSLQDQKLKKLGRIHNREIAINCIKTAQDVGFKNINIDLMYGLPAQTIQQSLQDLEEGLELKPTHLSWYQLTIEPNTPFATMQLNLPTEDEIIAIENSGKKIIQDYGYIQYEVSAYSKRNYQCCHNLNYWLFGDYLGLGDGAHGKITDLATGEIVRYERCGSEVKRTIISKDDLPLEFMLNVLRLYQPISLELFAERTGLNSNILQPVLQRASNLGLLHFDDHYFETTAKGKRFVDEILAIC